MRKGGDRDRVVISPGRVDAFRGDRRGLVDRPSYKGSLWCYGESLCALMSAMATTWRLVLRRRYRPWWALWLISRTYELEAVRDCDESDALRVAAELKAEHPKWELELRPD